MSLPSSKSFIDQAFFIDLSSSSSLSRRRQKRTCPCNIKPSWPSLVVYNAYINIDHLQVLRNISCPSILLHAWGFLAFNELTFLQKSYPHLSIFNCYRLWSSLATDSLWGSFGTHSLGNLRITTTTSVDWEKTGTRTSVSAGKRKLKMQSVSRSTTTTLNVNTNVKLWCSLATKFFAMASF